MNARPFERQLAVITGGASGIGLACAELLAERGAKVLLLDRQIEPARAAAQALGGQACGGRRHVTQNQDRLVGVTALRLKPCRLAGDLGGQADLQVLQSLQGGRGIGAQGIGLDHTHIPLAGAVVKRHRPHRQFQKTTRQRAREHQAPVGSARRQRRQNRRTAGPMPESVGADAGNDQHGNGSTPTGSADGVRSNNNS